LRERYSGGTDADGAKGEMMSDIADFIDRNEFMRLIQEAYQAAAEKAGTYCKDVVQVVRCKDCKWWKVSELLAPNCFCFRLMDGYGHHVGYNVSEDDYCSHGERREDV
jgi:hypothetical protein